MLPIQPLISKLGNKMDVTKRNSDKKIAKNKPAKTKVDQITTIPGVHKIRLSDELQKQFKCEVGVDVSVESYWTYTKTSDILDSLTTDDSVFLPFKSELETRNKPDVLLGYIPDETNEVDDFFICATDDSQVIVDKIVQEIQEEQQRKLNNIVVKQANKWVSQGSETVVDGNINKNNRPLIHVLLETKNPVPRLRTRLRICSSDVNKYMEIICQEDISVIIRRKIDNFAQTALPVATKEAQTICTFPKNKICQYDYQYVEADASLFNKKIQMYFDKYNIELTNMLTINGNFNLYTYDYHDLVLHGRQMKHRSQLGLKEYVTYIDYERCKGKMVETATWHPMMSWIFVVAYSSCSSHFYTMEEPTDDYIVKAVHSPNPVLIWSIDDYLQPKLVLETPREVIHLSFCPYDGNILIGGCKNGQVIIWDIKDKIKHSERNQLLNWRQLQHQKKLYTVIGWQSYLKPVDIVKATIVSTLDCSHGSPIVGIRWRSPYHDFSQTGQLVQTEDNKISMQFETCSLDGNVYLWDLCQKKTFKGSASLRRLKRKHSALKTYESPYKNLDLKPIYSILVKKDKHLAITHASIKKYSKLAYENIVDADDQDRVVFKPVIETLDDVIEADMHIGTIKGEYAHIKWVGQIVDFDEEIVPEACQFLNFGCYHDGPIMVTSINNNGTVLTVGGTVFALWRDDYQEGPILWRKLDDLITEGRWHENNQSRCNIIKNNGEMEHWMLNLDSQNCIHRQLLSNGSIFVWKERPGQLKDHLVGIGDQFGNFSLHHLDQLNDDGKEIDEFSMFIESEIGARQSFNNWQKQWCEKYVKKPEPLVSSTQKRLPLRFDSGRVESSKKPKKLSELEKSRIKWIADDKKRIRAVVKDKKQVDMKDLEWKKKPFEVLEEARLKKRQKLVDTNKKSKISLNEALDAEITDIIKKRITTKIDPYSPDYTDEEKLRCYGTFKQYSMEMNDFIRNNEYTYVYDIKDVMLKARERKKRFEVDKPVHPHRMRIKEIRQKRLEEQRRLEEEERQRLLEEQKKQEKKKTRGRLKTTKLKSAQQVLTEITEKSKEILPIKSN